MYSQTKGSGRGGLRKAVLVRDPRGGVPFSHRTEICRNLDRVILSAGEKRGTQLAWGHPPMRVTPKETKPANSSQPKREKLKSPPTMVLIVVKLDIKRSGVHPYLMPCCLPASMLYCVRRGRLSFPHYRSRIFRNSEACNRKAQPTHLME